MLTCTSPRAHRDTPRVVHRLLCTKDTTFAVQHFHDAQKACNSVVFGTKFLNPKVSNVERVLDFIESRPTLKKGKVRRSLDRMHIFVLNGCVSEDEPIPATVSRIFGFLPSLEAFFVTTLAFAERVWHSYLQYAALLQVGANRALLHGGYLRLDNIIHDAFEEWKHDNDIAGLESYPSCSIPERALIPEEIVLPGIPCPLQWHSEDIKLIHKCYLAFSEHVQKQRYFEEEMREFFLKHLQEHTDFFKICIPYLAECLVDYVWQHIALELALHWVCSIYLCDGRRQPCFWLDTRISVKKQLFAMTNDDNACIHAQQINSTLYVRATWEPWQPCYKEEDEGELVYQIPNEIRVDLS